MIAECILGLCLLPFGGYDIQQIDFPENSVRYIEYEIIQDMAYYEYPDRKQQQVFRPVRMGDVNATVMYGMNEIEVM